MTTKRGPGLKRPNLCWNNTRITAKFEYGPSKPQGALALLKQYAPWGRFWMWNSLITRVQSCKFLLKYLRLLHYNAPAHNARILTEFLKAEKVKVLPHPAFSPDLVPGDYFLFPKLKFHLSGKRYKSRNALGSAIYQYLMSIPIQEYENCFQKWIDRLKTCIRAEGEYFEGQGKLKWSDRLLSKGNHKSNKNFGTSLVYSVLTVSVRLKIQENKQTQPS